MQKMSYIEPEVIRLGTVEEHTAALTHGHPDLLGHGDIL